MVGFFETGVGTNVRFCYTVFIKKKGDFLAMKRTFLFATIASILSINAYAVSATVTSKDYVDTTRQATIPASGTNSETPGDTVVTYTDTAGTIGERFIFDGELPRFIDDDDDIELTTVRGVKSLLESATNLPETTVTYKTCTEWSGTPHTDENCILWNLTDKYVYGCDCSCRYGGVATCNSDGTCNYNLCNAAQ